MVKNIYMSKSNIEITNHAAERFIQRNGGSGSCAVDILEALVRKSKAEDFITTSRGEANILLLNKQGKGCHLIIQCNSHVTTVITLVDRTKAERVFYEDKKRK